MGPVMMARELASALRRRPRLLKTLELLVAVIVIALCAFGVKDEWSKAGPELEDARLGDVGLALIAVAVYYLVFILGWIRILAAWGIRVPYRAALQAEMASMLAKYVPGGVWTPAARIAALSRLTGETAAGTVLASILVEAVLSAIAGVVVFVVSLAWVHDVDAPLAPLLLFALFCVLILHPRIFRPVVGRLLRPFGLVSLEPLPLTTMASLLAFYCFTWLLAGLGLYFLIRSVGPAPSLETIPFLGGTAAIGAIVAVLAVFAPSGLGVREATMYGLLIAVTSNSAALGTTILNRLTITIVELALFLVGIAIWRFGQTTKPKTWNPETSET
jgi:uncharacterized membrane protein YbhN (UPF0104 family)